MRTTHNKLVCDHIPEIIETNGGRCEIATLSEVAYRQALLAKLVEEATEAAAADPAKLVEELADLYEIVDALMAAHGIERKTVLAKQAQKRVERGGFQRRILLRWTEC